MCALSKELKCDKCEQNLRLNLLNNLSVKLKDDDGESDLKIYVLNKIKDLMIKPDEMKQVDALLNIGLAQWHSWIDFIDRKDEGKDIIFHTYHGTKGEEYENVAIIMEHSFGGAWQGKDKIKKYFHKVDSHNKNKASSEKQEEIDLDFESSKNLLYVACSRAIKNLRILYIDDIADIRNGIESIFGEILEWKTISV